MQKVLGNKYLLAYIVSFQDGRAYKDWTDGDKAAELGHEFLIKERLKDKKLILTENAIDLAVKNRHNSVVMFLLQNYKGTHKALNYAVRNEDMKMFDILERTGHLGTEECVAYAASTKLSLSTIKELILKYGFVSSTLQTVIDYDRADILEMIDEMFPLNYEIKSRIQAAKPRRIIESRGYWIDPYPGIRTCNISSRMKIAIRTTNLKDLAVMLDENDGGFVFECIITAAALRNKQVLKLIESRGLSLHRWLDKLVQFRNLWLLQYINKNYDLKPREKKLISSGNIDIISTLWNTKNLSRSLLRTAKYSSYEVVKWIMKNSEQDFRLCDLIYCNNLDLLKRHYSHPSQITVFMITQAVKNQNIEMLDWLLSKNNILDKECIMNFAVSESASFHMVKYLYEKGADMTSAAFLQLIKNNDINAVKWLLDHGHMINESYVDTAIEYKALCMLRLMLKYFPHRRKNIKDLLLSRQCR